MSPLLTNSLHPDRPVLDLPLIPEIESILEAYPASEEKDSFLIEINSFVKSTSETPKPDNINGGQKKYGEHGVYWVSAECSLTAITTLIERGFCLRLGVKWGGTSYKSHFVSTNFIYLDFDEKQTVSESVSMFEPFAFLVYGTPSYTVENQKHRVLIRLSDPVSDASKIVSLLHYFRETFPCVDPSCVDPARVMYGSLGNIFHHNDSAILNVEDVFNDPAFIKIHHDLNKKESVNTPTGSENKFHKPLIQALAKQHGYDLNSFFKQLGIDFEFNFKKIPADFDGHKWEGSNPFSPTNSSGTSLVVSIKDGKILVSNRANNDGGTIFGFVECLKQGYDTFSDDCLDSEAFTKCFHSCLRALEIDSPDLGEKSIYWIDPATGKQKLRDIVDILERDIIPEIEGYFYRCPNVANNVGTGENYYVYNAKKGTWTVSQEYSALIRELILPTFQDVFGRSMPGSYINGLTNRVLTQAINDLVIYSVPVSSEHHVFFSNGAFNLLTKQLESYTPELWCMDDEKLKYPYRKVNSNAAKLLVKGLKQAGVIKEDRRIVLSSFILSMQKKFYKTNKALYLAGVTTTGKSSTAEIFAKAQGCSLQSASDVSNNPDHFGSFLRPVTVLDEVSSVARVANQISTLVRAESADGRGWTFRFCDKYVKAYQKTLPITLILTGESFSLGSMKGSGIDGMSKRMITVEFLNQVRDERNNVWKTFHENINLVEELACWAVTQGFSKWQDRVKWLKDRINDKSSKQQERCEQLLQNQDNLHIFITHFSEDPLFDGRSMKNGYTQSFTGQEIVELYKQLTNDDDMVRTSSDRVRFLQRFSSKMKQLYPKFGSYKTRIGSSLVYKYFGIVVNDGVINADDQD